MSDWMQIGVASVALGLAIFFWYRVMRGARRDHRYTELALREQPPEPSQFGAMIRDRGGVLWVRNLPSEVDVTNPWLSQYGDAEAYGDIDVIGVVWPGLPV